MTPPAPARGFEPGESGETVLYLPGIARHPCAPPGFEMGGVPRHEPDQVGISPWQVPTIDLVGADTMAQVLSKTVQLLALLADEHARQSTPALTLAPTPALTPTPAPTLLEPVRRFDVLAHWEGSTRGIADRLARMYARLG